MFLNLTSLLCLLNIGIGSSVLRMDWHFLTGQLVTEFLSKFSQEFKQGDPIPFTCFGDLCVAAAPLPTSNFLAIPFTMKDKVTTIQKTLRPNVSVTTGTTFEIVAEKEYQCFDSELETKEYGEFFLRRGGEEPFLTNWCRLVQANLTWGTLTLLEFREIEINGDNPKKHTKRWGVIYSKTSIDGSRTLTLYGFALCVEIDTITYIIGFSQYASNPSTTRRGLYEYCTIQVPFGSMVRLVMLYSGRELQARAFVTVQIKEILATVVPLVGARVPTNATNVNLSLRIIYAWRMPGYDMAILELTITYVIESVPVHPILLYFFVLYYPNASHLETYMYLGTFESNWYFALLMLFDHFYKTQTTGLITKFEMPVDTIYGMLICVLDYVARKCIAVYRGDVDQTPYLNHLIQAAWRLVTYFGITDFDRIAALLLNGAILKGWVRLDEVKKQFGDPIFNLLSVPRPDLTELKKKYVPERVPLDKFEFDLNKEMEFEGRKELVYDLVQERIQKKLDRRAAYVKASSGQQPTQPLKSDSATPPHIRIKLFDACVVAGTTFGLYKVLEQETIQENGKPKVICEVLYQFVVELRGSVWIIGELTQPQDPPWPLYIDDFSLAHQFSGVVHSPAGGTRTVDPSVFLTEMSVLINTAELVARKSSAWSLRAHDMYNTAHINKAFAICRILILEGNLRNRKLIRSALAHGLLVNTEITYEQLCKLLGNEVARTIKGLAENYEIKDNDIETKVVECMKVLLIKMTIMLYETRQLTQECYVPVPTVMATISTNKKLLGSLSKNLETKTFAVGIGAELVKVFNQLKTLLQKVLDEGLEQFSPPPPVISLVR